MNFKLLGINIIDLSIIIVLCDNIALQLYALSPSLYLMIDRWSVLAVSLSWGMASNLSFLFIRASLEIYYFLEVNLLEVSSHRQGLSDRQGSKFVIHKRSYEEIFIFVA